MNTRSITIAWKKYNEMVGIRKEMLPVAKNAAKRVFCDGKFKGKKR